MYPDINKVLTVASLGGGPIGAGWAAHFLSKGYKVKNGHRQFLTQIMVEKILEKGAKLKSETKAEVKEPISVAEVKPAVKKPAVKKPAAKKPVAKKPAAKKPVAKKPAAKKPAAKKTTK